MVDLEVVVLRRQGDIVAARVVAGTFVVVRLLVETEERGRPRAETTGFPEHSQGELLQGGMREGFAWVSTARHRLSLPPMRPFLLLLNLVSAWFTRETHPSQRGHCHMGEVSFKVPLHTLSVQLPIHDCAVRFGCEESMANLSTAFLGSLKQPR